MCCRFISQHPTMWPNMRHSSMGLMWPGKLGFAELSASVIRLWLYIKPREIGMQWMPTWHRIGFMSRKFPDFLKAASTHIYLGQRMKLLMCYPNSVRPEIQFHQG